MAEIKAALVKELRDATNVGMMECKRALVEADGDMEKATKLLRERGLSIAGKKSGRSANQGVVATDVFNAGKSGVMIEVNCETDFVARNENFQAFVGELLEKATTIDGDLNEAVKDEVIAKIAEIGENIIVQKNTRMDLEGSGVIACYVHLGGKVGVLVEVGCDKEETATHGTFREVAKDITLHIAASNPLYLNRDGVSEDVLKGEREIFAKQAEGKPENIVEKIVNGKIEKYFGQVCLLEQDFVKDPDHTVTELLKNKSDELEDQLVIRRFVRYQIGT